MESEHAVTYVDSLPLRREDEVLQKARDRFRDDDPREAIELCSQLIDQAPALAEPYYRRARCWQRLGRHDSAEKDFTRAVELLPEHQEYRLSRCLHRAVGGDLAGALEDVSRWVVRLQPVLEKPELFENLLHLFQRAAGARPEDPDLVLGQGLMEYLRGQYEAAADTFTRSLRLRPSHGTAILCRALAHTRLGEYEKAAIDLSGSLLTRPNWAPVHHAQGVLHHSRGELDAAREEFTRALTLDPDYYSAYRKRGILLHLTRDYPGAAADFTRALQGMGESPDLLRRRGWSHMEGGDPLRALEDFDRCLILVHRTRSARTRLIARLLADRGLAHLKLDDHPAALEDLQQALELNPDCAESLLMQGLVLFVTGKRPAAMIPCTRAATASRPGTGSHHAAVGILLCLENDTERARLELRKAAELFLKERNGEMHQRLLELVP